jgi:hypothetical protein
MGKKKQKQKKKREAEELERENASHGRLWPSVGQGRHREPEPYDLLANLRELIDRENISEAASNELLRGNVVLRGDGRTFRSSPYIHALVHHIPYIPYTLYQPDLLHLDMRNSQRLLPCLWCEQDNAEQE